MTTSHRIRSLGVLLILSVALAAGGAGAATISIVNNDGVGEGFNDPTPRAPVGGNPGTTLGAQRLFVFQHAASIWGSILPSNVEILVRAQFNPQTCTATSAVLGSAGPVTVHRDFAGAPFAGFWYHQSLGNRLAGVDLSPTNPDITATFNLNLDSGTCLGGAVWYYGIDGNEGTNIELLPVVLHELGHGLGSSTTTSGSTGNYLSGFPHIYDRYLMDNTLGLHWYQMTALQRQASAISLDHLVWDGLRARHEAQMVLGNRPQLFINSPAGIAGTYAAQSAAFGAALTLAGVTGDVVLADDGAGTDPYDACEPLINGGALAGKIALIHRGTCTFVSKALAAQAAGAIGLLVSNNVASGLPPMGGTDPSVTIPCIGISQATGNAIEVNLGAGVNVRIGLHALLRAGADASGRVLIYAPSPFASGSSVSHWDVTLTPNALMEPAINNDLHDSIDITHGLCADIGWFGDLVPVALQAFSAEARGDGILLRWRFADPSEVGTITVERATAAAGSFDPTPTELGREGAMTTALDMSAEPGQTYFYRLRVTDRNGEAMVLGQVSARREVASALRLSLGAPRPNPASRSTSVDFRIAAPQSVRLTICDVSGREVRTLHDGQLAAGAHVRQWDGRTDAGTDVAAGVYFFRLHTQQGVRTQRVTVVR